MPFFDAHVFAGRMRAFSSVGARELFQDESRREVLQIVPTPIGSARGVTLVRWSRTYPGK